jgi:hypothetical protein
LVAALQAEPRLHDTLVHCRATAHRLENESRAGRRNIPDVDGKLRILDDPPQEVPA